jgi:uracil phosphoribosyltransferase
VGSIRVLEHSVIGDLVARLRSSSTENDEFLRLAHDISRFVAYEALRDYPTSEVRIDTPVVAQIPVRVITQPAVIIPILRAGLGMSPAVQSLLPHHRLCLLGLRRNEETLQPEVYHDGIPADLDGAPVVVCDPMLATGGSLVYTLDLLATRNAGPVTVVCLIAAQPGVERLLAAHPAVNIVAAALDGQLNDVGYITPGLGDAGDRLFGPPVR